jgi:tetratricopeptide (TPR) repeat protein
MIDSARIEELRRRVARDPASISFAALAEEYRRAGRLAEAIDLCRNGLARHPAYLSARVTLGRALLDSGDVGQAEIEFEQVVRAAPENLAAIRGLAAIHRLRGDQSPAAATVRTTTPASPEAAHRHETNADAALAGLESFLAAIQQARRTA